MRDNVENKKRAAVSGAMAFITLMGIVSLFSDMTHEGARSVLGEYLNLAGASAATIGFVSGVGELCGYSLRLLSGLIADKTKKYWTLVIVGYTMQVLAIPALALIPENGWIVACGLVILERVGKAIKKPAKNTLVSFAASEVGTGKGFAYQEFLDQLGAFLGPVILFALFWKRANKWGALAGMISGGVMVFVWKYLIAPIGGAWGIYELLPAFTVNCIVLVVVSLATPAPEKAVTDIFEEIRGKR